MPGGPHTRNLKPLTLIPVAVLLVLHPLLIHGPSCGQDLAFHVQSWLDAAQQLRHGTLYPHWDTTAAWNAGEPRFLFYPPISWLLGAILTLIFPVALCPTIFIAIALLAAGFTFHKLASEFASPNAALIASTLYLANPYMLFTAFERSALAELLAAAWIPLLLLALLRPTPTDLPSALRTIRSIAVPLALLWLTNAPAAVIGSYTLALIATFRVLIAIFAPAQPSSRPERSEVERPLYFVSAATILSPFHLALTFLAATTIGLTLPALYLLPAAYERRNVQTAMALLPNMRYQDNFLFTHTADAPHNAVNQTISHLALTLLLTTAIALITLVVLHQRQSRVPHVSLLRHGLVQSPLPVTLTLLAALIAILQTPISALVWEHLPNLAYLQFPWRLLTLLTPILALTLALLLDTPNNVGAPFMPWLHRGMSGVAAALTLILPLALAIPAYRLYHQPPDSTDDPTRQAQLFTTHHGSPPTDEYTPTQADNDPLRTSNPAYWLANSPNDPAPNTTPTAVELNPSLDTDDTPIPDTQTLSTPAPHHLQIHAPTRSYLILNLRDYPNWDITEANSAAMELRHPAHISRADGLIAIALDHVDNYTIDITWHRTPDQTLGLILSTVALIALAFTYRSRQPEKPHHQTPLSRP